VPHRRAIGQQQFGPAPESSFLLAGEPVPQGRDQVVVRQLVVLRAGLHRGRSDFVLPFRVGRRDEADFTIEDTEQIVEVPRAAA